MRTPHKDRTAVHRAGPRSRLLARWVAGLFFVAMAVVNVAQTVPSAERVFTDMRDDAWMPPYPWLIDHVVLAAPVVWAVVLVVGELAVGGMFLASTASARWAALLAALWVVALIPALTWPYFAVNIAMMIVFVLLAVLLGRQRTGGLATRMP